MKKMFSVLVLVFTLVILAGCNRTETINVGVQFYPMKDILELIKDDVEKEGYKLVINEFAELQPANNNLAAKELDANMIQHGYYLEQFNIANDTDLVVAAPIYHATYALYSKEYTNLEDIPAGTVITLPNDSTNLSRALYLLHQSGLITLKPGKTVGLTVDDILENPKNLDLTDTIPITSIQNRYEETGFAVMYPTYARALELEGDEQRLYVEQADDVTSGYAISLVSRADNLDSEVIELLIKYIQSDKVRDFLIENYSWASSPAF